jgi:hypothetical protein
LSTADLEQPEGPNDGTSANTETPSDASAPRGWSRAMKWWTATLNGLDHVLGHPAVLLLLGAGVTGLLVPHITTAWQNQQKALDIKTNLVSRLSNAATKIIVATQFAELGSRGSESSSALYSAYRDWAIDSAGLSSELRAYFPHSTIGHDWDTYAALVTNVYALTGVQNPPVRRGVLKTIQREFYPQKETNVDWQALVPWDGLPLQSPQVGRYWFVLRTDVLNRKSAVIQEVLSSNIVAY